MHRQNPRAWCGAACRTPVIPRHLFWGATSRPPAGRKRQPPVSWTPFVVLNVHMIFARKPNEVPTQLLHETVGHVL